MFVPLSVATPLSFGCAMTVRPSKRWAEKFCFFLVGVVAVACELTGLPLPSPRSSEFVIAVTTGTAADGRSDTAAGRSISRGILGTRGRE